MAWNVTSLFLSMSAVTPTPADPAPEAPALTPTPGTPPVDPAPITPPVDPAPAVPPADGAAGAAADAATEAAEATTEVAGEVAGEVAEEVSALMSNVSIPLWAVIAIIVLIAAAAVAAYLLYRRAKRPAVQAALAPQIGKLHQQGARSGQQDCFSVSQENLYPTHGLLAVVADGMGGLEDGDQVSQTVVGTMIESFYKQPGDGPADTLRQLLYAANGAVNRLLGYERIGQCGSTVVAGLLKDGYFHYLSVGDSRICLYRGGCLFQLNREHNFVRELEIRAINGEGSLSEARSHPKANGLTSFLGMGQLKYVDQPDAPIRVMPGDRFILMSDGVYNALPEQELCRALEQSEAQAAADALGAAVAEKNWQGQDNYTAVIVQC